MSCVIDNTDQLSGVVTVLHDTTREREIAKMKSDFVSHVSHELRTPLSSIKAYAELLVDGEAADDKTRNEFYHVIQNEANRLSRLIDNILNISRIESGMMRVTKKSINVNAILKEVLEVAMPTARDKRITLVDQVPPGFFQVEADRDMIYQAALNLLSNAIKYTPLDGTVKVTSHVDESANVVTVLVTDTGVGIPPDAMRHLFEKFYRVEQNKNMAKGSGLGLNLTRQMIETVHKGKMVVTSEVGKGSTFGFTLPIMA
jgi:two-component system phosphate regulon sensor histidine kinase PhoR